MLEKFSIYIKYRVDDEKKARISEEMENDDYAVTKVTAETNRLVLDITPKPGKTLHIDNFSVIYDYDYLPRFKQFQRIYVNGYQSWTCSREYFPSERCPISNGKFPESYFGDYQFTESENRPGFFHSSSYTYIRNNTDVELFGSLNEATGFTTFYIDIVNKIFKVAKDLEGVEIDNRYEALNIARYNMHYDEAFNKWFHDMHIAKPRLNHARGYTTWYNYYGKISESTVKRDLDAISSLDTKIDIFEIDDGYENCVGDWTDIKSTFGDMGEMADAIHDKDLLAGIWLVPFAVSQKSNTFKEHPDWVVKDASGKPFKAGTNWGGFYTLDIYNPEVKEHLKDVFHTILDDWGYDMVKLDHLYQVAIKPYNNKSRGEIMTDAMNLLRELVGEKLILACGVPLYPAFGKVDFCRVGPDMSLDWKFKEKGYLERVSAINAINNSIFRRHLNGRAFINDPDVFLLRDNNIKMKPMQRQIVATMNMLFGNMLFTSDDMTKYKNEWQKDLVAEIFGDKPIHIMSAEYVTNNIIHVKCLIGDTPTLITVDMKQGLMLRQEVDMAAINADAIDANLSARGGMDYENALDLEDDTYDDFDFDRELTPEEQAEMAERKRKAAEAREKRIEEIKAKRKAERDAKRTTAPTTATATATADPAKTEPTPATATATAETAKAEPTPAPATAKKAETAKAEPTPAPATAKKTEPAKTEPTPAPATAKKAEPTPVPATAKKTETAKTEPTPATAKKTEMAKTEPTPAPATATATAETAKAEPTPAPATAKKAEPKKTTATTTPAPKKTAPATPTAATPKKKDAPAVAPTAPAPKKTAPAPAPKKDGATK